MKLEDLKSYFKEAKSDRIVFRGNCHDCNKELLVKCDLTDNGKINIRGGAMYQPKLDNTFFKCDQCYDKDSTLTKYNRCEVYSRIVGYLRPVQQWNSGKAAEWKERVPFELKNEV